MTKLEVEFLKFKLRNPLIAAPGPMTRDYTTIKQLADAGIAAAITKTILLEASINPRPCLYRGKNYLLNTERCSTLPLKQWLNEEFPRLRKLPIPIIASIGMTPEEVEQLAPLVVEAGAKMVECSIFTDYDDPTPMVEAIKKIKTKIDVPVIAKLSPNVHDLVEFGNAARAAGADAISAIDALKAGLRVDIVTGRPMLLEQGFGRISGEAIKPLALYSVAQLAHYVGIPVIGIGGVFSGQDVIEMLYCGASVVGICTALIVHGPTIIGTILQQIAEILSMLQLSSLQDIQGKALKNIDFPLDPEERREYEKRPWSYKPLMAFIEFSHCIKCGQCKKICLYHAIVKTNDKFVVTKKCQGCGLCVSICPTGAITFIEGKI